MKQDCRQAGRISHIRALAQNFSAAELDHCLARQIEMQSNRCLVCADNVMSVDLLARAAWVRNLVEKTGVTPDQALRKLGHRMRRVHRLQFPQAGKS